MLSRFSLCGDGNLIYMFKLSYVNLSLILTPQLKTQKEMRFQNNSRLFKFIPD
jgi:hypothetical protein